MASIPFETQGNKGNIWWKSQIVVPKYPISSHKSHIFYWVGLWSEVELFQIITVTAGFVNSKFNAIYNLQSLFQPISRGTKWENYRHTRMSRIKGYQSLLDGNPWKICNKASPKTQTPVHKTKPPWLETRACVNKVKRCLGRGVRSDAQLSCTDTRFQSALRVVKMVLNTQCYQFLWLTMWFHAKKITRNTQKIKLTDFTV